MDIRLFFSKTRYMNVEVNGKIESVRFIDDSLFFKTFEKVNNDSINHLREVILYSIANKKVPDEWYERSKNWCVIRDSLFKFINTLKSDTTSEFIKFVLKAGRTNNYDFDCVFDDSVVKLEFKYGCTKIEEYPEILSMSSDNFIKKDSMSYSEYFYDNFVDKLKELYKVSEIPEKDYYLKNIHKSKDPHSFFIKLKEIEENHKNEKKVLVDDSIDTYINEHLELDYSLIQSKLENSQIGKKFMLWKGNRFYMDYLRDEEVKIKELSILKKNKNINTVVLKTNCNTEYHMLLRWKNRLGILYPAWQIRIHR